MKVKIQTMLGDIVVRLYDETPIHCDNFLKLAKEGYYDGTLFHRSIGACDWFTSTMITSTMTSMLVRN